MSEKSISRRSFLRKAAAFAGLASIASLAAACGATPTPQIVEVTKVVKETVMVEKKVEVAVTKEVVKEVTKVVEKPVEVTKIVQVTPAGRGKVTLRFHFRSSSLGGPEEAMYVDRVKEFMAANPGIEVKNEDIPGGQADVFAKYLAMHTAGNIGDLVWTTEFAYDHSRFAKMGMLAMVDEQMKAGGYMMDQWYPGILDTLKWQGKVYGLPKGSSVSMMSFFNVDMFKKAGIPLPTDDWTIADQEAAVVKLTKGPEGNRDVWGIYTSMNHLTWMMQMAWRYGGDIIDEAGKKSLWDQAPIQDGTKFQYRYVNELKACPTSQSIPSDQLVGAFIAGKIAIYDSGRWNWRNFQNLMTKAATPFELGAVRYPWGIGKKGAIRHSVDTHTATALSKFAQEAFLLVYALADDRCAYLQATKTGYLTGRKDTLLNHPDLAKDTFLQLHQRMEQVAIPGRRFANFRGTEYHTTVSGQLDKLWVGGQKPDAAFFAETQKIAQQILDKPE